MVTSTNPIFGKRVPGIRYIVRPSVYALVCNEAGEFAAVRTPKGYFLPGGGIDKGETPEAAMEREAAEECGWRLHLRGRAGEATEMVYSPGDRIGYEKRCTFFTGDVAGQVAATEADHELEIGRAHV